MERKELKLSNLDEEQGTFEGMLSPYEQIDQGGDIVERGAYAKTIREQGNSRPLLWQHKADTPIGLIELVDSQEGLRVKGKLLLSLPMARDAYELMKARVVKGLSIGYTSVRDQVMESGVRRLKEIRLFEGSLVTFQMAPGAVVDAVKSAADLAAKAEFERQVQELRGLIPRERKSEPWFAR
jgi:uncharacterized protein